MSKDFLFSTAPCRSTKHCLSTTKPPARPTCEVRTTAATDAKVNKPVVITILNFIGVHVICKHSIHFGCVKLRFYFSYTCHNILAPELTPTQTLFGLVT